MNRDLTKKPLPQNAEDELREAKRILEHHGIADRLTEMVGAPINASLKLLPDVAEDALHRAIEISLSKALDVTLKTLDPATNPEAKPHLLTHKVLAGLSGAAGGALGGATVMVELPVSTVLILRSIADIARSQGEDLSNVQSRLACLEVFALDSGKANAVDDDTEIGYFAVRAAMAKQIRDASQYIAQHGISNTSAPPLVKLVTKIGERFGLVVSEKLTAQAIPVMGAIGGALINTYFIDHYQDLARAHFSIRRLERQYGPELIQTTYESI